MGFRLKYLILILAHSVGQVDRWKGSSPNIVAFF